MKQDLRKHQKALQLIEQAVADGLFLISTLSLNELSFVLAKLKINRDVINSHLSELYLTKPEAILLKHFKRAAEIAY
nr:hypothetical protein [Tellurirhabdus rosea]